MTATDAAARRGPGSRSGTSPDRQGAPRARPCPQPVARPRAPVPRSGPASRADIARSTGLTRVTVSGLVADLIAEGLVEELGVRVDGKVGKPATLVGMRTEAFQIVAVDLTDDSRLLGAVMTLVGDVVARRSVALEGRTGERRGGPPRDPVPRPARRRRPGPVIGVGIASPGVIDIDGTVVQAPNRGWYHLPLAAASPRASASRSTSPTTPTRARSASSPTARPPVGLHGRDGRARASAQASSSTAPSSWAGTTRPARSAT